MMTILTKIIIALTFSLFEKSSNGQSIKHSYDPIEQKISIVKNSAQTRAFEVLTNKCNICHAKRNRRRVFTEENMNEWAADVYKQVFIKKRMPKGKKIKLTNTEYQDLLTWISSTKK